MDRRFQQAIEKILSSFESVNEWADVIKFLSQLSKTLSQYESVHLIPCDVVMAKRLAQCLNPALPVGVHSKALEVYSQIFSIIQTDGLAENLHLYVFGLFSLFGYASMTIKPQVINLFETFLLPLKQNLFPCYKGLIIACLAGLDDESNEYFGQIYNILDEMRAIDKPVFYESLWSALITAPQHRFPAIAYLSKKFTQIESADILHRTIGNMNLFLMAINCCLSDSNILTQRACLDFILTNFTLNSNLLSDDHVNTIMESALAVTLRKDMSLNRRLYTWLMGPGEGLETRYEYFRDFALENVKTTILKISNIETDDPNTLTRPYKILISLLDRQQLGLPVVEAIFYDLLISMRFHVSSSSLSENVRMEYIHTFAMFLGVLDPFITWSKIHELMKKKFEKDTAALLNFFIQKIKIVDDETLTIHLPLFALSLLRKSNENTDDEIKEICLKCSSYILNLLPGHFIHKTQVTADLISDGMFETMDMFYNGDYTSEALVSKIAHCYTRLLFELLGNNICTVLSKTYGENNKNEFMKTSRNLLVHIGELFEVYSSRWEKLPFESAFDSQERWVDLLVKFCLTFGCRSAIKILVEIVDYGFVNASVFDTQVLVQIIDKLWVNFDLFDSEAHISSANLIWKLHEICSVNSVESVLTEYLSSGDIEDKMLNYERFGTFWRISEQIPDASIYFSRPLFLTVELLKSKEVWERRVGETFLRCSLKSLARLLDPMLCILLDLGCMRKYKVIPFKEEEFKCTLYESDYNFRMVGRVFEMLIDVFQYGGIQLVKNLGNVKVSSDCIIKLVNLANNKEDLEPIVDISYLNLMLDTALDYMISELTPRSSVIYREYNHSVQVHAADFLQYVVSRAGDVLGMDKVLIIQEITLNKILFCIATENLDLQTKLISLFYGTMAFVSKMGRKNSEESRLFQKMYSSTDQNLMGDAVVRAGGGDISKESLPLFVRTILEAFSSKTNRPILPYYMDFVLSALPFLKKSFRLIIIPLIECLCDQLIGCEKSFRLETDPQKNILYPTDLEVCLLLNGLEKIMLYCFSEVSLMDESDGDRRRLDAGSYGLKGISDFVTGVFTGEVSPTHTSEQKMKEILVHHIVEISSICCGLWKFATITDHDGLISAHERIRYRIRRLMDVFVQLFPTETLEALIICWLAKNSNVGNVDYTFENMDTTVISILHSLKTYGAKEIVQSLIQLLKDRMALSGSRDKLKKNLSLPNSSNICDMDVMRFMEYYCGYCIDRQSLTEVFPLVLNQMKEYLNLANQYKHLYLSILMNLTSVIKNLPELYLDDKRYKKDILDTYQKVCDFCILIAGRSFEGGFWRKKEVSSSENVFMESSTSISVFQSGQSLEKASTTAETLPTTDEKRTPLPGDVVSYFASILLPSLRSLLEEHDRITALLANMIYYVVTPNLRARMNQQNNVLSSIIELDTLKIVRQISSIGFAYKVWRKDLWEFLLDPKFFDTKIQCLQSWQPIVQIIGSNESDRMDELLGRVITTPIGIFTSKDQEYYSRAINLRRVSFMLFSGDKDQFVTKYPLIQEKLVEMLKQPYSIAHAEVYLCLRILYLKVSSKNLMNLWPVVVTDLIRLFTGVLKSKSRDIPKETLLVLLNACKFLDLLLVMANEDFQLFSWIFINDSSKSLIPLLDRINAMNQPKHIGIIDLLGVSNSGYTMKTSDEKSAKEKEGELPEIKGSNGRKTRRPLIDSKLNYKSIQNISQLNAFFRHASSWTMEGIMNSCKFHYEPFPATQDSLLINKDAKGERTTLNEKTVDLQFVEELVNLDFLENPDISI